jgi:hypothetical protein
MQVKDKQYLANVYNRIKASVATVNAKIAAEQQGQVSLERVMAAVALERLAMQHDILIVLATIVYDPGTDDGPLPEMPRKFIGFN